MMTFDMRVGEDRLEPAADLDADLALVRRDDQEHAVVLLLGADAPMAAELIAEILDGVALQRGQRDHHDLVGALVLERLEVGGRARHSSAALKQIGVVDDAAGELRKVGLGGERGAEPKQRARSRTRSAERHGVEAILALRSRARR